MRAFEGEGTPPDESGIVPRSARRPESLRPSADSFDHAFFAEQPKLSLPPSLPPPVARRPVSRVRTAVSLMLFVVLFGGVGALLGMALLQKLAIDPSTLVASAKSFVASVR